MQGKRQFKQLTLRSALKRLGITFQRVAPDAVIVAAPAKFFGACESNILWVVQERFGIVPSHDELQSILRSVSTRAPDGMCRFFNGQKTFRDFIIAARATDDPCGDFILDTRRLYRDHGGIPDHFDNLNSLVAFMHDRGACVEALEAARKVWSRFRRWKSQQWTN